MDYGGRESGRWSGLGLMQVKTNAAGQVDWAYFNWNLSQAHAFDLARGDRALQQNPITPNSIPF